jgi:hypothetical protein
MTTPGSNYDEARLTSGSAPRPQLTSGVEQRLALRGLTAQSVGVAPRPAGPRWSHAGVTSHLHLPSEGKR